MHKNVEADITLPAEATRPGAPPMVVVKSQQVAEGVFWLTGGTHHSLAIAMEDHIVLVDTPNGEARASAVIAKAKELIPGKPIRYVVATHHHWDHLGGIRTAIDEGATIVTHRSNQAFLKRAATAPHTIAPDRLSKSKRRLMLQTLDDEGTLTGRHTRRQALSDDRLRSHHRHADAGALLDNIRRRHLDVQTIVPFHGLRTADLAAVARQAGRPVQE